MKYIGFNNGVIDAKKAVVSALDHGFLYGIGLFETFRTYGGVPFLLERHLERMAQGARRWAFHFSRKRSICRIGLSVLWTTMN